MPATARLKELELFPDLDPAPAPRPTENEGNPFRKQFGLCVCKCAPDREVRVFWCHACGEKLCWECFKRH